MFIWYVTRRNTFGGDGKRLEGDGDNYEKIKAYGMDCGRSTVRLT